MKPTYEQLAQALQDLNGFNVFDYDPCTLPELTAVKDRCAEMVKQLDAREVQS